MKSFFNKNFIIALVLVLGLGLLYWGIEFLKGANLFEPAKYYITKFENVNGLNVSTPITVNGYQVGLVKELNYDYKTNMITVKMSLDDELKIPVGSSVQLSSELLGGASLSINLAKNTAYYKVGDEISLTDSVEDMEYNFTVTGISEYSVGFTIFTVGLRSAAATNIQFYSDFVV